MVVVRCTHTFTPINIKQGKGLDTSMKYLQYIWLQPRKSTYKWPHHQPFDIMVAVECFWAASTNTTDSGGDCVLKRKRERNIENEGVILFKISRKETNISLLHLSLSLASSSGAVIVCDVSQSNNKMWWLDALVIRSSSQTPSFIKN